MCSRTALPIWYINPVTGDNRLFIWGLESLRRVLTLVLLALLPVALAAQAKPAVTPSLADESLSRWDIFLGYSYLAPDGTITGTTPSEFGRTYGQINLGEIVSVSRYFNRYVGLQAEGDLHQEAENFPLTANNGSFDSNDDFAGASGGVIFRFPAGTFTPFVHALGGTEEVGSVYQYDTWGSAATFGGGVDIETPMLHHRLAARIQGDYQYIHADSSTITAYRLSAGLVYHIGPVAAYPPVTLACSVSPATVFSGDPITVTGTASNLNPKMAATYNWNLVGGTISGTSSTVYVDTRTAAPGDYTVTGHVSEGAKPGQSANCTAQFTIHPLPPPTTSH